MSGWDSSPIIKVPAIIFENEFEFKRRFAEAWLRCKSDPVKVACSLFPDDTAKAMFVARVWPTDSFVLAETERLIEEFGKEHFLPDECDLALALFEIGTNERVEAKDRINALMGYGKVRGFIKESSVHIGDNVMSNKVMIVADSGTDEEWEAKLKKQQKRLVDVSKAN